MNQRLRIATALGLHRVHQVRRGARSSNPAAPPPRPKERKGYRASSCAPLICAALLAAAFLWAEIALADQPLLRGPRAAARPHQEAAEPAAKAGVLEKIAEAPVLFYQRFLAPSWGRQCTYYPSCSNYALQAIRKHGAFVGSIMAFDRLQHEADEVRYSPLIVSGGEIRGYDPLENNDYWWYTAGRPEQAPPAGASREAKP